MKKQGLHTIKQPLTKERPGMGLHLLNRNRNVEVTGRVKENVEKAELKLQHARDKLDMAQDHKREKIRLKRFKSKVS
jgi:hypothetical protein